MKSVSVLPLAALFLAMGAYADDCSETINVGGGPGYQVIAPDDPAPPPPDFIVNKTWLVTPWGTEVYKYGMSESFDTKAQSENIGDGPCVPGEVPDIIGHFYLSRGYKEDPHSGDGSWRRIDSTTTKCDNLKPGDTHTETKNTVISQWITAPGIYNIVYCIDHPLDDHNNGGDHQEKHESNNCSTEAVFEVTANAYENLPNYDLIITSVSLTTQQPVPIGSPMGAKFSIRNIGDVTPSMNSRSCYDVNGPGTGGLWQNIASDQSDGGTLIPGVDQYEQINALVPAPTVPGTYTLRVTANCINGVPESDYTNNSFSITFQVAVVYPKLVITRFEDKVGCCTTNTGAAPKPRIWVRNDGARPTANVMVVYQVSSPLGTGGVYQNIGYGTIEPRELAPGDTDEDQMDCDGCWRIPKSSAWKKQWHNFRACLRQDGSFPTGDPNQGDICAVYSRYSKE